MTFLSVMFAYVLSRFTTVFNLLHHDAWHARCVVHLQQIKPGSLLPFWVMSVGVAVAVGILLAILPFWWSFLGGILALLFSLGRVDWRQDIPSLMSVLREGKAESIWLMLESRGFVTRDESAQDQAFWLAWCRYAGYRYLDGLFTVLFWFFLLGPVAAVFYRLVSLYNSHPQVLAGHLPALRQYQTAIEWLPVRYMAFCCCLAGNFTTGFHAFRQLVLDTRLSSADVLARCLDASLVQENPVNLTVGMDETVRLAMLRAPALEALLERTEIIGLVVLAFAILVFH